MINRQSVSATIPAEIDETSSPTSVYARDNVEQFTIMGDDQEEITQYRYDERVYDKKEWHDLQVANYVLDLEFNLSLLETQGGII